MHHRILVTATRLFEEEGVQAVGMSHPAHKAVGAQRLALRALLEDLTGQAGAADDVRALAGAALGAGSAQ